MMAPPWTWNSPPVFISSTTNSGVNTTPRMLDNDALTMAGLKDAAGLDLLELDSQTGFHELAFRAAPL